MSIRIFGFGAALSLAFAGAAFAHPHVVRTTPTANGEVNGAPKEIHIVFSEAVTAKLSGAQLVSAAGAVLKTGEAKTVAGNKAELVVPVTAALTPGVYKVNWHAVAADTHRVTGAFSFTVK
jgi:methionine-rich copper-binding protein CopC